MLAWLVAGCGDAAPSPTAGGEPVTPTAVDEAPVAAGDPLLSQAREGIREGALPEPLRAEVLGSPAPAHARARRVLLAMADPGSGSSEEGSSEDDAGVDDGRPRPPPILPPADDAAVPEPVATADATPRQATAPSGPTDARPPRPKAHAELGGLALRASKGGATLTIAASSSLVVGVASQPSSGIVRLMIDAADAGTSVLTARPRTEGAAVTGVRKGQGTVQITVTLEPGWSLGSVKPFSGGAKVHLVAPS